MDFNFFPKIPRLFKDCTITEKIDGTHAGIYIDEAGEVASFSRNRFLTLEADNFGFARWVRENLVDLFEELGPGTHYGEWWGQGIQRRYDAPDKRFSLFNATRWAGAKLEICRVVPVLYTGLFTTDAVGEALALLGQEGSKAAPGFMRPEGVVVFHHASGHMYKHTLEGDRK
jgi:hypothetical protein